MKLWSNLLPFLFCFRFSFGYGGCLVCRPKYRREIRWILLLRFCLRNDDFTPTPFYCHKFFFGDEIIDFQCIICNIYF